MDLLYLGLTIIVYLSPVHVVLSFTKLGHQNQELHWQNNCKIHSALMFCHEIHLSINIIPEIY